eukprot:TRINITY_DN0_c5412_g1_i1.p1 TRINITY_DN0_c5412_g1~~TRINITY_DN0_c5412_g1_i1.p1  ORF type:complete len:110 (+),score=3.78 TRINITY_DN0_c5412_g1_i1:47-376(+)
MVFSQTNCVICLEDFEKVSKCRQISLCSHIFHSHCIDAWMKQNSNCPVCKKQITEEELQKVDKNSYSPLAKSPTSTPNSPDPKTIDEFTTLSSPVKVRLYLSDPKFSVG